MIPALQFGRRAIQDPHWAKVSLLMHFEEPDESTTFIDHGPKKKSMTAAGTAKTDNGAAKFGSASLLIAESGGIFGGADDPDFNFSAGDFTWESFYRPTALPTGGDFDALFSRCNNTSDGPWLFLFNGNAYFRNHLTELVTPAAHGMSAGVWYHIAAERYGSAFNVYRDGSSIASGSGASVTEPAGTAFHVGCTSSALHPSDGRFDEVRITKGVARYKGAFTAPTAPFWY